MEKRELLSLLTEIRKACEQAIIPGDMNLNLVIEEIDRLAAMCIASLTENC